MLDCKECKTRHRADNLIQEYDPSVNADAMTQEEMVAFIREKQIPCPVCKKSNSTDIRQFNLMFETKRGVTDDSSSRIFLRPENAQGEYVNYLNVMRSMRAKLPFSIGQIGKAFRNEIAYEESGSIGKRYRRGGCSENRRAVCVLTILNC